MYVNTCIYVFLFMFSILIHVDMSRMYMTVVAGFMVNKAGISHYDLDLQEGPTLVGRASHTGSLHGKPSG